MYRSFVLNKENTLYIRFISRKSYIVKYCSALYIELSRVVDSIVERASSEEV